MDYTSLDEAVNTKLELVERIQSIDVQIGEKALTMTEEQYEQWRVKALRAKQIMTTKLQRTKIWIQHKKEEEAKDRIENRGGGDSLLADLYSLVKSLVSEGAEITHEEQVLLDDVQAFLGK